MTAHATDPGALAETGIRGLRATTPFPLPFAPDVHARAFLLERPAGNVLVYSTGALAGELDALRAAGGAQRQYLNHWHESLWGFAPPELHARLIVHGDDAAEVARRGGEPSTFDRAFPLDDDFEAIPIPGHTPGATAYLWRSGDHRLLFSGDSLYLSDGRWRAAVLDSSDRARYLDSLALIRELDFDVLVPWATSADGPLLAHVTADERRARLDEIIARVRAGADG